MHAQLQRAEAGPGSQVQHALDIQKAAGCMFSTMNHVDHKPVIDCCLLSQEADAGQMLEPPQTSASAPVVEDDDAVLPVGTQQK